MLRLSPAADLDIREAAAWYDSEQAGLGDTFVGEVRAILQRIDLGPLRYPIADGTTRRALLRRFPYGVYFEPDGDDWIVLAVLHQRRDPAHWQARRGD